MLTKRQKQIFDYIAKYIKENDYAPSLEETKRHFRLSSIATVHQHIETLREKGYLKKIENQPRSIEINKKRGPDLVEIPLLGTIAAGEPIEAIEDKENIEVPKSQLSKSGEHFALRVSGDSMIDEGIFNGDTVVIRKQPDAENGETVVALINGNEVTLKKIYKEKNGFRLQPANLNIKPIFTKELTIQGKVISVIRDFEELKNLEITKPSEIKKEDKKLNRIQQFVNSKKSNLKMIWGDAGKVLNNLNDGSINLIVTSPPYFNAREYSKWNSLEDYLNDMRRIFQECYRVLGNHRVFVLNVGDVNCQLGKQPWTKRRVPLGALFTVMFREIGFEYVDDFIWDKGEPQSYRHKNDGVNYPFYQYPINCYEHILIFHKHRLDPTRIPCPVCGSKHVQNNSQSEIGVQSWECNNEKCLHRSPGNRGKRFSARSIMMQKGQKKRNWINDEFIHKWRRDIVKFSPVIKFGPNGENRNGHTAPFPTELPEMAIRYYSYIGDKVLDPFSGSFTTSIVAAKLKRIGIGIDINKKLFHNVVKERIIKEFGQPKLKLYEEKSSKMTFKELDTNPA